ncbi:MAG: M1 family metallopeptidase [Ignavibacteriaceae bacterium]|nr:M1 family metallopeptidase [Ignavibacteriaceae bacterium]
MCIRDRNYSDYKIDVSLTPVTGLISGNAEITYHNNSPAELKSIIFRLYPDIYRANEMRNSVVDIEDINEGMIIKSVKMNGSEIDLNTATIRRAGALLNLKIPQSITSGSSVKFEIEWEFTMPKKTFIRMGTYGDSTYFVAYWYPQIAVYDDIHGWDRLGYNGEHEFYNDFNNYEVNITVPNGCFVWATGDFLNPGEVYTPYLLGKYNAAKNSDKIVKIIDTLDLQKGGLLKENPKGLTYRYKYEGVPDFAFAVANNYLWDGVKAVTDSVKGTSAFVSAAYNPVSKDFYGVCDLSKEFIEYFSHELPGVPYPYPVMTVFNGDGGMEFPMMVNDGSFEKNTEVVYVTSHEIAHTYLPFLTGINEKRYGFMDEGMAVYLPMRKQTMVEPNLNYSLFNAQLLSNYGGMQAEMPLMIPSWFLKDFTLQLASYTRSSAAFFFLEEVIGYENMQKSLREFINRWRNKKATPYDFFYTVENVTGKELWWFWNPWFFELGNADLGIGNVDKTNEGYNITILKKGKIPVPVYLTVTFDDESSELLNLAADAWENHKVELTIVMTVNKKIKSLKLGEPFIPDVDTSDNEKLLN